MGKLWLGEPSLHSEPIEINRNIMGLKMKHQLSFGNFVMVVLGCYFAFVIINANIKLQSGKIGTIFGKVKEKTLQGKHCCTNGETWTNVYN